MPVVIAFCGLTAAIEPASAQTWTQTSATNWIFTSIASSADGSKLMAVGGGLICASTNSGATWMQLTNPAGPTSELLFVTLSADGTKIAGTAFDNIYGYIYTSTNFGLTWVSNTVPSQNLMGIASSADGARLVAVAGESTTLNIDPITTGPIYVSTNAGVTWAASGAPSNYWSCVASSADGTKLAAGMVGIGPNGNAPSGLIYVSSDSGTTWKPTCAPSNAWASIASSADGTKLAAASLVSIYTSPDAGATWVSNSVQTMAFPLLVWQAITMSADGTRLATMDLNDHLYSSTNFGASWVSNSMPQPGIALASSADGNKLAASVYNQGGIYTLQFMPNPQLNIAPLGGNCILSWIVPATKFVLQQSPDLSSWTDVTNPPALNLSNLCNEVFFSPTSNSGYFRLISQ